MIENIKNGITFFTVLNLSENNMTEQYEMLEKSIIQGLGLSEDSDEAKQILKEIKQFYFGDEPITKKKLDNFIEVCLYFTFTLHRSTKLLSKLQL